MPRNLDSATQTELSAEVIYQALFAKLVFESETAYISSLPFNYIWGGNLYAGSGTLGKVSGISENIMVQADGVTVSLSGIDLTILPECIDDVRLGADAILYLGLFDQSINLIATPTVIFAGLVDQPSVNVDGEAATISLKLENSLIRLQRACNLMLTPSDQKIAYPDDTGLDQVNLLAWQALKWGT